MKFFWCILTFVVCMLFPLSQGFGLGMEVDPPEIVLKNCPLGEKVLVSDIGGDRMKLVIQNKAPFENDYVIDISSCKEKNSRIVKDYVDIPDASWITPETYEVSIPANGIGEVELYLDIPDKEEFAGKKYQAIVEVKSRKKKPEDMFVLAVQIRMMFSIGKNDEISEDFPEEIVVIEEE